MQCCATLLLSLLCSSSFCAAQQEGNIADLLADNEGLDVLWGIPDSTAVIGKAFHFTVPEDAFSGDIDHLEVTEAGRDTLPSWLHYDAASRTLRGVPYPADANHQTYIEVTAKGQGSDGAPVEAKDIFAILITKDDVRSDAVSLKEVNSELRPIRCPKGSSVTRATIVIDAGDLSSELRWALTSAMAEHLGIPRNVLRLLPVDTPFLDSSALVAGPGDVTEAEKSPVAIEWEVGCGNVQAVHMPILTSLEASSKDGRMRRSIGHGIVGWHVTNHKAHTPKRPKRQAVQATATPEVSFGLPTDRPVATVTITSDMPTSRSVPTMASPSFTDVEPSSSSSRSKHKPHRTKTTGRHLHKTKHPKHSPTPLQTPTASTSMPIMPTPVSAISPSSMEPSLTPVMPIMSPSSPGLSPSYLPPPSIMTPSFSSSSLSSSSTPTDILPTPSSSSGTPMLKSSADDIIITAPTLMPSTEAPLPMLTSSPSSNTPPPNTEKFKFAPVVKQYLRPYKITEGDILDFHIPEDTFNDYEDGNTRNLKLILLTIDGLSVPPISWIQLNDTSQTLYGLPREFDIRKHEYLLAAIDSDGKLARLVFEMIVERRPRQSNINHEFSITLDLNYKAFMLTVDQQINVAKNLAKLYGDPDTQMISIIKLEEGSVRYVWTNNSLPTDSCPIRDITGLLSYLITIDDTLNPKLMQAMEPTEVLGAGVESRGTCEGYAFENEVGVNVKPPPTKNEEGEGEGSGNGANIGEKVEGDPRETSDEDVMITTVIPAVVIAAMLLLAGLIACILYRKKRKGKLSDEDQHTFINKGIPIIFADELEERHEQPTKPLILANEKPPLPPPDYPRSASGSVLSTPRSDHKEPLIQDPFSTDDEGEMSPYHPPPPVTGGSLGRSRTPNSQPAFRSPPPYVPP
ncbi:hypothetical protein CAPTEDRAFT_183589 [Capitella teleta]|uniref:Dystroglycan 1 n=1 Tax=Capitella teleta TaxID=283909 RepID=R7UZC3_CAPTE|nr:hypothetical protein CAPTEDRAFT_183589 [Capitella teleta]|eukprot:ELU11928.1 hypothetical protein CAPTEDRAFT_183589 [Capitella teleta]